MSTVRRHLLISGRVQGVCFRHYTRQTARANAVSGWVRNLPDGRVEAVIEGEPAAVEATIDWCRRGPDMARVDRVKVREEPTSGDFESFEIR